MNICPLLRLNLRRSQRVLARSKSHTVVMVRHGESIWNVENKYSGWCDIPLTENGEADAVDAGRVLKEKGMKFDVAFTSNLERAWRTCALALSAAGQSDVEMIRSSKLNERHYGALQGHRKNSKTLREVFGQETINAWKFSYNTAPPSMYDVDFLKNVGPYALFKSTVNLEDKYMDKDRMLSALHEAMPEEASKLTSPVFTANAIPNFEKSLAPETESLKQCEERAFGYWKEVIAPRVLAGERVLIVAHANTIRALVKAVDRITDAKIEELKIPNGVPLVYTMNDKLEPLDEPNELGFQANYLVTARSYSKLMSYERSYRKKLRSLFEYCDVDGEGRIDPARLARGLARLQRTYNTDRSPFVVPPSSPTASSTAPMAKNRQMERVAEFDSPDFLADVSQKRRLYSTSAANLHVPKKDEPLLRIHQIREQQIETYDELDWLDAEQAKQVRLLEDLLRNVASGGDDPSGRVTLNTFLQAEQLLLQRLSEMKIIQ